jgi:hypothetical protein
MWFRKEKRKSYRINVGSGHYGKLRIEDLIRMEGREPGGVDLRPEVEKFLKPAPENEIPEGIEPWNPPGETRDYEIEEDNPLHSPLQPEGVDVDKE